MQSASEKKHCLYEKIEDRLTFDSQPPAEHKPSERKHGPIAFGPMQMALFGGFSSQ